MADKVFDKVATEVADYFGVPRDSIKRTTTALDVEGWDSIRHTNLLMHLEDVFGIQFPEDKILTFNDVGEMADCIEEESSAGQKKAP